MPKPKSVSSPTVDEVEEGRELARIEDRAEQGLEPLKDSPVLNKLLLRNARQPVNIIATRTGMTPQEVSERLVELLDNPDWRDDLMEEKLLLAEVSMLVDDIRERMTRSNLDDESWMQGARVQLAAIKTMLDQLDKRRKAVDGHLSLLTKKQAELFAEAVRLNNTLTVEALARKYGLEESVVYAEWAENFPKAIEYLEARSNG